MYNIQCVPKFLTKVKYPFSQLKREKRRKRAVYDRILFLPNNFGYYLAEMISAKSDSFCLSAETELFDRNAYFLQKEFISGFKLDHMRFLHSF